MPDVLAKAMAVIMGGLLVLTVGILVVTSRPSSGSRQVVAEFRDAFPILEGMAVRTNGAPAGSIGKTRVNKQGLATVTLLVDKSVPAPRADATATIRQFDSTGDSYVSYDPGSASEPLADKDGKPTITCSAPSPDSPCTNTLAAPRLDDLVNAFGPSEEAGVKLILQSLSDALDARGADVNKAALRLVPALDAADRALGEVDKQNGALKSVIGNLEAVSKEAASKHVELGQLIDSLAATLSTTAAHTAGLDAGLASLPATERSLRSMLASLDAAAKGATPLAGQLAGSAPQLSRVLDRAPSFLDDLRTALRTGRPTLDLTRRLLVAGAPTIAADPQRVVTGAFDLAPAVSNLLKGILGSDDTIKAFFGDDKNGAAESRPGFGFGLGAIASEPGNGGGYPADWATRNFIRVSAILNCQTFGVPVSAGCLARVVQRAERQGKALTPQAKPSPKLPAVAGDVLPKVTSGGGGDSGAPVASAVDAVKGTAKGAVQSVLDALAPKTGGAASPAGGSAPTNSVTDLLDYLLG